MHDGNWFERLRESVREHEKERAQNESSIPRYDLEGTPKQGGMGSVFRAWDRQLGRQVAVKFLSERLGETSQAKSRFQREAELAARLDHPNIVRVYDAGTWPDPEKPFIVMQYVEGASLDQAAIQDLRKLVRIVAQAARALHYAHEQGIVHRDLKPQNILLDREGRVFVTDFGLARGVSPREGSSSLPGEVLGTPLYMPPEQALGKLEEVDPRSDVYSLGATLYTLAAGKPPVDGTTAEEVRVNVVTQVPVPLRKHRPDCSEPLERIVRKAMAKEKKERFPTAAEFAGALEAWLDGSLPRQSAFRRLAALLAVAAILLGSGGWFLAGRPSGDDDKRALFEEYIKSGNIDKAKEQLSQLKKSSGARDSRLAALEQQLRALVLKELDENARRLSCFLATGERKSADGIQERIKSLDPSEAPARIERAKTIALQIQSFSKSIVAQLQERTLPEVEQSIATLVRFDVPEQLLRPLRKQSALDAAAVIKGWVSSPKETPLEEIDQALKLLSPLVPGDADFVALAAQVRNEACRIVSAWEVVATTELRALYERIVAIDPTCPAAKALQTRCELLQKLEVAANQQWKLTPEAFKARDRTRLDQAALVLADAAEQLKTAESLKHCEVVKAGQTWLAKLDEADKLSSNAPQRYREQLAELGKEQLPEELRKAAAETLEELKTASLRTQATSLSQAISKSCSLWKLEEARILLQQLESLPGPKAEKEISRVKVLIQEIEEASKYAAECQSCLNLKKLDDARESFKSLRGCPVKHPKTNQLHAQLLLEFAELGDQESFLDGYRELGHDYLTVRSERARLAEALVRIADRAAKPPQVWNVALIPLDAALTSQPDDATTLLERASVRRRVGRFDLAIQDVKRANALSPSYEGCHLLGELHYLKNDLSQALDDFHALVTSAPEKPSAIYWRGVVKTRLLFRKDAIRDLEEALRLGQTGATVYQLRALNYVEIKDWDKALPAAEALINAIPKFNEEDRVSRSAEEVSLQRAKTEFMCDARLTHANAFFGLEQYRPCIAECEQVIKLDPRSAAAYFLSGSCKYAMGKYLEAILDLDMAKELAPENPKRVQEAKDLLEKCGHELRKQR